MNAAPAPGVPGLYGKLPAYGDFIQRNLPMHFVTPWDAWLQHFIAGSREKIGAAWLDFYLTSPIWRFAFSPGAVDRHPWAGILMPSVDQVGRYFPFTVAARIPDQQNPFEFLSQQTVWFAAIEELALRALDDELSLDALADELSESLPTIDSTYVIATIAANAAPVMQIDVAADPTSVAAAYPCLLDAMLLRSFSSYSVWSTTGSERVPPCIAWAASLPAVAHTPALLDGRWQEWGWSQPYLLSAANAAPPKEIAEAPP